MKRLLISTILFTIVTLPVTLLAADPNVTPEGIRITPDVVYGHKFGLALTFDMYQPKIQNGAGIIMLNSGGWSSQFPNYYERTPDRIRLKEEFREDPLLKKGFTLFSVRHGSSPKFEMHEIVSDLRTAVRFIRFHSEEYGIKAERLGIMGGSSGGHLSLLIATTSEIKNSEATEPFEKDSGRVAAVVAYFPPTDLYKIVKDTWSKMPEILERLPVVNIEDDQLKKFSPINYVTQDDPPTLIVHGDQDEGVPVNQGKTMYQALQKAGV